MSEFDRRSLLASLGLAAALSQAPSAMAAIQARPVGNVANVRGAAFAERGRDNVSLYDRSPVLLDDIVRTEPESRCALLFGTATTVRLGANVKLRIDRFIVNAGGVLTLEHGAVHVDKTDSARTQRLLLNSPYALIAIRGTSYFAGLLPDGFGVFVERGVVDVAAAGKRVRLAAGQGTRITAPGLQPEDPVVWGSQKIALTRSMIN
jgi:hypothetical protein